MWARNLLAILWGSAKVKLIIFVSDRGGISMGYLPNIRHRGVQCLRNCSTTRRLRCSPPHPGREQVVALILEAGE
jgi:hypothetical protein